MDKVKFSIRVMTRGEIDMACDWAAREGWNPGLYDAECFHASDPEGFFLGLLDDKPVAMVSAVAYAQVYGFMGFYIVAPEFRDTGYGLQLWEAGLKYLGDRCVGLDSVRPDLVSHKKPEFRPACANFRFRWIKDQQLDAIHNVAGLAEIPWPTIAAYDSEVFTFERENFLRLWISRPHTKSLGVVEDGVLVGYGVMRQCREGFKIGPLFANSKSVATSLFKALTSKLEMGTSVFLDVPEVNQDSVSLAHEYGMSEVFRTTRMYRGTEPSLPLHKWFGVTSFELG